MTKCLDCDAPATHIAKLVFVAFKGAGASYVFVDRPSCRKHFPKVEDVLADHEWPRIVTSVMAHGKLAPKRELTTIEMVPMKGHEARAFYEALERAKLGPDFDRMQLTAPHRVH